ncbi:protein HEG-like [Arapaima gigas]
MRGAATGARCLLLAATLMLAATGATGGEASTASPAGTSGTPSAVHPNGTTGANQSTVTVNQTAAGLESNASSTTEPATARPPSTSPAVPGMNGTSPTEAPNVTSAVHPPGTGSAAPASPSPSNSSATSPPAGANHTTSDAENRTSPVLPGTNETTAAPEPGGNSTAAPTPLPADGNFTTVAQGNTTTVTTPALNETAAPPGSNSSTPEPGSNSTAAPTPPPEDGNHTTVAQGNTTFVTTPALNETAAPPGSNSSTTVHPNGTNSSANPGSTQLPTTVQTGFCIPSSCPLGSTCVELYAGFTCQCRPGTFYSGGSCISAKVFPGNLRLTALPFSDQMKNTASKVFKETAANISETLRNVLQHQPGYLNSIVLKLSQGSVVATVENLYVQNSNATQTSVTDAITGAISSCNNCGVLKGANFSTTDLCDMNPGPCDTTTTQCSFVEGDVSCPCAAGYVPSQFSFTSCIACPSGEKAEGGKCVGCPFGYAGFNCNDSSLLAVVVVSCVLGGLLLIAFLALLACCCCRVSRKEHGYSSPYVAEEPAEPWPRTMPKIPRATTNSHWEAPQMEMRENGNGRGVGNRTGFYDVTEDEPNTFKNKNPSRYSYLVQGQENPYFVPDESDK